MYNLCDHLLFQKQMRSRGGSSSALGAERAERERERAALLRHARDEAERSLQLAAALSARDTQLRHAREQLFEASTVGQDKFRSKHLKQK